MNVRPVARVVRQVRTWITPLVVAASIPPGQALAENTKTTSEPPTSPRLLLVPYQPIFRSVPQEKATQATEFLFKELKKLDTLTVVRGGIAVKQPDSQGDDPIKSAIAAAEKYEAQKNIVRAIAARQDVITQIEKAASRVADPLDYVRAHHFLARAQSWAGQDEAATRSLETAVRMSPALPLAPDQFSRLYRRWVAAAATRVAKEKTGKLMVKSALPGATVFLDGRKMAVAPVALQNVVPGQHLVGAKVDGVPVYRAVVRVEAGKQSEFRATFGGTVGGVAVGEVTDAISINGLPKTAVQSAVKAGQAVEASYVVAGGMSKEEDHFNVYTYVVDVNRGHIQALDPVRFDLDLLTAEADVFGVVRQIESAAKGFSGQDAMIAMIERRIDAQSPVNTIDAHPDFKGRAGGRSKSARTNNGPRKVIRALNRGRVKIKDEED